MQIGAGKFKAQCLRLMDRVRDTHEEIVITKHGRPVARLMPIAETPERGGFGCMKGTVEITGDIVSPPDVKWGAEYE